MLVLTRKIGEVILIGDNVRVMIVGIDGQRKVRVGIDAPLHVRIVREGLGREGGDEETSA
jgi:carbon storage regulator